MIGEKRFLVVGTDSVGKRSTNEWSRLQRERTTRELHKGENAQKKCPNFPCCGLPLRLTKEMPVYQMGQMMCAGVLKSVCCLLRK